MKTKLVVADSGSIFSLAIIDKLEILSILFKEIIIAEAVWFEITKNKDVEFYSKIHAFFKSKVCKIKQFNDLIFIMDFGESESVILYKEKKADFLLIDDKKARIIAESL